MGQGVWIDSDKLEWDDEQRAVLGHGTLSIGFIGLAETLVALTGHHHGEDPAAQNLGLEIIGHMRKYLDKISEERHMNYTLLATPAEGLSGRFVRMDRERYGSIPGVTDRDYYTNSFHIPVYFRSSSQKIEPRPLPRPHNAGHIPISNRRRSPENPRIREVIRWMNECGIATGPSPTVARPRLRVQRHHQRPLPQVRP